MTSIVQTDYTLAYESPSQLRLKLKIMLHSLVFKIVLNNLESLIHK